MELNTLLKNRQGDKMGLLVFENGSGGGLRKLELSFGVDFNSELQEEIDSLLKKEAV